MELPSKSLRITAVCLRCVWLVPASLLALLIFFGRVPALFSGHLLFQALFGFAAAVALLCVCAWVWKRTIAMGRGETPLTTRGVAARAAGMPLLFMILLAIVLPKYMDLMRYVTEAANQGGLGAYRTALESYRSDHEGLCPPDLGALKREGFIQVELELWKKRLRGIPHRKTAEVVAMREKTVRDTGEWGYVFDPEKPERCEVFIDCSHTDTRGEAWDSY